MPSVTGKSGKQYYNANPAQAKRQAQAAGDYDDQTEAGAEKVINAQSAHTDDDSTYKAPDTGFAGTATADVESDRDKSSFRRFKQNQDVAAGKQAIKDRNPGLTDYGVDQVVATAAKKAKK